jgi:prefoldin subunit 5
MSEKYFVSFPIKDSEVDPESVVEIKAKTVNRMKARIAELEADLKVRSLDDFAISAYEEQIETLQRKTEQLESALEAEREKHRFIPVSERLPENGDECLLVVDGEYVSEGIYSHNDERDYWINGFGFVDNVTHWQPMPDLPEEGDIC